MKDNFKEKMKSLSKLKKPQNIIIQEVKLSKKRGRKSSKNQEDIYIKISPTIRRSTHKKLKLALINFLEEQYTTQEDFIDDAILHYLNYLKDQD